MEDEREPRVFPPLPHDDVVVSGVLAFSLPLDFDDEGWGCETEGRPVRVFPEPVKAVGSCVRTVLDKIKMGYVVMH